MVTPYGYFLNIFVWECSSLKKIKKIIYSAENIPEITYIRDKLYSSSRWHINDKGHGYLSQKFSSVPRKLTIQFLKVAAILSAFVTNKPGCYQLTRAFTNGVHLFSREGCVREGILERTNQMVRKCLTICDPCGFLNFWYVLCDVWFVKYLMQCGKERHTQTPPSKKFSKSFLLWCLGIQEVTTTWPLKVLYYYYGPF